MYSFFVLGLIPGTNFQITFQVWLDVVELSMLVIGIFWLIHMRLLIPQETEVTRQRLSLPATQLHSRLMASGAVLRDVRARIVHNRKVILQKSVRFYQEYYPPLTDDF